MSAKVPNLRIQRHVPYRGHLRRHPLCHRFALLHYRRRYLLRLLRYPSSAFYVHTRPWEALCWNLHGGSFPVQLYVSKLHVTALVLDAH
jgi:hypothetical protein